MIGKVKTLFFYFSIVCAGASVLVLEIGGTRILAPFYGSTVYVWTSLITIALFFLALGYVFGGRIADTFLKPGILWTILLGAGIFIYFIPFYDTYVLLWSESFGIQAGPLVAAAILFSLPLLLLGMVAPFAARVQLVSLHNAGQTIGKVYAVETFGGLLGALLSGFLLAPLYSSTSIMQTTGLLLVTLFIVWEVLNVYKKS